MGTPESDAADAASAALSAAALGPAEVSGDAGTVRQYSLAERIALDRYLRAKAAASSPRRGLRFTKLIPPGSV